MDEELRRSLRSPELRRAVDELVEDLREVRRPGSLGRRRVVLERIERLIAENPRLRQIVARVTMGGTPELTAALEALEVLNLAAFEVELLVGLGIILPASRMGQLVSAETDSDSWATELTELWVDYARARAEYDAVTTWTALGQLRIQAANLAAQIRMFLRYYPTHPSANQLGHVLRRLEQQIAGYDTAEGPSSAVHPPPDHDPPPPGPGVPGADRAHRAPEPPGPHRSEPEPPTIAKPPTSEWLQGEQIRRMIEEIRKRIRRLKKVRREALRKDWRTPQFHEGDAYISAIDESIDMAYKDLERYRHDAEQIGQSTGEDCDEPLDDPPPPREIDRFETWLVPVGSFVNRDTGEMATLPLNPPPEEPWVQVRLQPPNYTNNVHWGWRLSYDEDGHCVWTAGWIVDD